jgi:hypothetical protein
MVFGELLVREFSSDSFWCVQGRSIVFVWSVPFCLDTKGTQKIKTHANRLKMYLRNF